MKRKLLLIFLLLCGAMINAEAASYSGTLSATYTYDASAVFTKEYSIYDIVYACRPANAVSTRYVRTITPNYIKADGSTMSCTDYHQTGGFGYFVFYYANSSTYYSGDWPGKLYMCRVANSEFTSNYIYGQLNDKTTGDWGFEFACPRNSYRKYEYSVTIKDNNGDTYTCVVTFSPSATTNTLAMKNYSLTATNTSSKTISVNSSNFVSNPGNSSATKTYTLVSKKYFDGTTMSSGNLSGTTLTYYFPGIYTLRVSQSAVWNSSSKIHSKTVDYTFTVNRIVRTMSFTNSNVQSSVANVRGKNVSELNVLNMTGDGTATYSVKNASNQTVTLTDGKLPADLPAGTYTVTANAPNTNYYASKSVSYTLKVLVVPELSRVLTVKPNVSLDMTSFIKNYSSEMNPTFTCVDANVTISGTTFSSAVEGEYFVNVSTQGSEYIESKEAQVKVIVSRHNHPYYEFKAHVDMGNDYNNTFDHWLYTFYLPAWDFEAQVCGQNVRFCINDDDASTVTLVSGTPIQKRKLGAYNLSNDKIDADHTTYERDYTYPRGTTGNEHYPIPLNSSTSSTLDGIYVQEDIQTPIPMAKNEIVLDENVNYITAYRIDAKEVIIPETVEYDGTTYTVTKIGVGALANGRTYSLVSESSVVIKNEESIKLPASIVEIDNSAFHKTNASKVNFEELPNLKRIGYHAFSQSNIKNLDLTKNTELTKLGRYSFYYSNLETANISGLQKLETEDLDSRLEGVFENCLSLTSLDMSNLMSNSEYIELGNDFCDGCKSLRLPKMDNSPIGFAENCFRNCKFDGQTFDLRRLKRLSSNRQTLRGFYNTGLKNLIAAESVVYIDQDGFTVSTKPMIENIFILNGDLVCNKKYEQTQYTGSGLNRTDGTVNKTVRIFLRQGSLTKSPMVTKNVEEFGDECGPRIFPMLSSNTSGVRTMSYFRPLDYKNIKVFDNTQIYDANKPDGTDYEFEDFFRTDLTDIEMLTPYVASSYNVDANEVTLAALSSDNPGIIQKGGVYYKGTGTATDSENNDILYILTEPEYSLDSDESKLYTNMYSGYNYLKGGGKDAVNLSSAPHMTEESTQYISKNGEFHYCTGGTLAPYKAYLDIPEKILTIEDPGFTGNPRPGSSNAKGISIVFKDYYDDIDEQDDQTTGVHGAVVNAKDVNTNDNDWYNMQGMKVQNPRRGVFVNKNGNKAMFK